MNALLADVIRDPGPAFGSWGLAQFLIALIVVAALCAIVFLALKHMGVQIPAYVIHVGWIIFVAVIAIVAIRFLLSM